jgi:hypothetical protein
MLNLVSIEQHSRNVLVAVELLDPVSMNPVSQGLTLTAQGLSGQPIINLSGRFVWMASPADKGKWPSGFVLDPRALPYEKDILPAPEQPSDLANPSIKEPRLTRYLLRPNPAYPFSDGLTVIRGRLLTSAKQAQPIPGAEIWLRWKKQKKDGVQNIDATVKGISNSNGDFAAFLRLPANADPKTDDQDKNKLDLQIVVFYKNKESQINLTLPEGLISELQLRLGTKLSIVNNQ